MNSSLSISAAQYLLPETIVYDTMLNELENDSYWSEDFLSLIKLGVFLDLDLFELLTQLSPTNKNQAWTPYLELVIDALEKEHFSFNLLLTSVGKSFYQLNESHYLNLRQKEYIAFLLVFFWNLKKEEIYFDFEAFFYWFQEMVEVDLRLPAQMNTYDLAESVCLELGRFSEMISLEVIGKFKVREIPTIEEMYHVIESYRLINSN